MDIQNLTVAAIFLCPETMLVKWKIKFISIDDFEPKALDQSSESREILFCGWVLRMNDDDILTQNMRHTSTRHLCLT